MGKGIERVIYHCFRSLLGMKDRILFYYILKDLNLFCKILIYLMGEMVCLLNPKLFLIWSVWNV